MRTARQIASELEREMRCYCDLDNWEPERKTGHSWVCPIHKKAVELERQVPRTTTTQEDE